MKLAAYAKYKPSNIDWAGDVPADWSLKRVREGAKLINGYPFDSDLFGIGEGLPLVRIRDIASNTTEVTWTGPAIRSARIERGDILVGMDGDFNVARWTGNSAMLNQRVCCVRTKPTELDDRFLFYFLLFPLKTLNDVTYSTTVKHLSSLDLLKFRFYAPNVREQHAIADFLDRETARLDTLVGKKRELIEKLKEKRTALISRTVTRGLPAEAAAKAGLNPHPNLKPSGIEWLGHIPERWEVLPLTKYVVEKSDYRGKTPEKVADGVFLVTAKNVRMGWIDYEASQEFVLEEDYAEIMRRGLPKQGDILFTTEAPLGNVALVDREDVALAQRIIRFRVQPKRFVSQFALYGMMSDHFQIQLKLLATGSTAEGIKASKLHQLKLLAPPRHEQVAIANYLDHETEKIDNMIEKVEVAIEKLQEYRTALITAAVTGKIDVRNGPKSAVST